MLRAAALAVGATLFALPAAAQADDLPIRAKDPSGDVNIFDGGGTKPSTGQRKTIDLRSFSVAARGDGVRFSFAIARIAAGRTFDQVVAVSFDRGRFDLLANPQRRKGTTISGSRFCSVDVSTLKRNNLVRVDVPTSCLPEGAGVLRVSAYLQEKNGAGPGFSEDTLRVPGEVSLR